MAVVTEDRKSLLTFRMDKVNGEIIIQVWKSEQICEQNITEVKKNNNYLSDKEKNIIARRG